MQMSLILVRDAALCGQCLHILSCLERPTWFLELVLIDLLPLLYGLGYVADLLVMVILALIQNMLPLSLCDAFAAPLSCGSFLFVGCLHPVSVKWQTMAVSKHS